MSTLTTALEALGFKLWRSADGKIERHYINQQAVKKIIRYEHDSKPHSLAGRVISNSYARDVTELLAGKIYGEPPEYALRHKGFGKKAWPEVSKLLLAAIIEQVDILDARADTCPPQDEPSTKKTICWEQDKKSAEKHGEKVSGIVYYMRA